MRVAYIAQSPYHSKPDIEHIKEITKSGVNIYSSFAEARELFSKRYDAIILYPSGIGAGNLEGTFQHDDYPESIGKKILTDIIRSQISTNLRTPTAVILVDSKYPGHKPEDYMQAGADMTWSATEGPEKIGEFLKRLMR